MSLDRSYEDEMQLQKRKRHYESILSQEEILDVNIKIAKKEYLISLKKKELENIGKVVADPNATNCIICVTELATHAIIPCGHRNYCEKCIEKVDRCSICRTFAHSSIKIYT